MSSIQELKSLVSKIKRPRYKNVNGTRIKIQEYDYLVQYDRQQLELLKNPLDDKKWKSIDEELTELNEEWQKEIHPTKKKILELKYELTLELSTRKDSIAEFNNLPPITNKSTQKEIKIRKAMEQEIIEEQERIQKLFDKLEILSKELLNEI